VNGGRDTLMTGPTKDALCSAMADMVITVESNKDVSWDHQKLSRSLAVHVAQARLLRITDGGNTARSRLLSSDF